MNLFDMRTVIFSYAISNFICMAVIVLLWYQNRRQFAGLGFWLADFVMQLGAVLLIALRGRVPDFMSMTTSNALVIGGTVLLYMGLERFVGKRGPQLHNYILLGAFTLVHAYFVYAHPSLTARTILFSFGLLVICSQCAWLLLRRVNREMRSIAVGVGMIFALFCLVSVLRIAFDLLVPVQSDFFHSNIYDTASILTYQMLFIILTFNLFLMVNRRLVVSLSLDITERKRMEVALQKSEERYRTVANYTYDWEYWIAPNGKILYISPSCERITGYCAEEFVENPGLLDEIVVAEDRPSMETHKASPWRDNPKESPHRTEFRILRRDGEVRWIGHVCQIIRQADGTSLGLRATNRDITERLLAENIVRLRLRLWEYVAAHSIDELMQKALDEIGVLTDSPIGFYHFVDEDRNALSLQAWSTRTLTEFCKAEGRGLHYPISEAGVWVDCVQERKPVIHNDYASLPHRKGMPAGHAEVIRELVVPTLRHDRIVAILGVGNKPTDYNEKDIELVSYIADIIWSIIEQKHADEQIRQLNSRLEQMAMTDELTGLENRRSFFMRGGEEIKRAHRNQTSLSLLMLDIDDFKLVNDTYGHETGDLVLQCLAQTLQNNIREIDILARLGGEEFGILLPNISAEDAARLGERLRLEVEKTICSSQNQSLSVTVSVGVTTYSQNILNLDAMLSIADQAMYQAKNMGRNQVVYLG